MRNTRNFLLDEQPLLVMPRLAKEIGLNESIVLQQVHYWLQRSKGVFDGYTWIYNSYPSWQEQFPFWCERTIKSIFASLEKKGLLVSGCFNKKGFDRTKWYRIDYDKLSSLTSPSCKSCPMDSANFARPIPETTQRLNGNNTYGVITAKNGHNSCELQSESILEKFPKGVVRYIAGYYCTLYEQALQRKHPPITDRAAEHIAKVFYDFGIPRVDDIVSTYEAMIDRHFANDYNGKCDYNIVHFFSGNIREIRWHECYRENPCDMQRA